jgi:methylated-DNA-[protein]-cysteine S-methyltransferase
VEALVRRSYDAPGWGAGEVWVRGAVVLLHVLAGTDPTVVGGEARTDEAWTVGGAADRIAAEPLDARPPRRGQRDRTSRSLEPPSPPGPTAPRGAARPPEATLSGGLRLRDHDFVADLCRRFVAHLSGDRVAYDDVELDLGGRTDFECELTRAVRRVAWGEVVSYGELAALAGRPGAARAAGTFCAGSDVALVIPCHRVIAADGIGGYGSTGVLVKRRLLALEGVRL